MLAKATDRMDALMSQKPFWKMFADPSAILAVQELAMEMLADVVVELEKERKVPALAKLHSNGTPGEPSDKVCRGLRLPTVELTRVMQCCSVYYMIFAPDIPTSFSHQNNAGYCIRLFHDSGTYGTPSSR